MHICRPVLTVTPGTISHRPLLRGQDDPFLYWNKGPVSHVASFRKNSQTSGCSSEETAAAKSAADAVRQHTVQQVVPGLQSFSSLSRAAMQGNNICIDLPLCKIQLQAQSRVCSSRLLFTHCERTKTDLPFSMFKEAPVLEICGFKNKWESCFVLFF